MNYSVIVLSFLILLSVSYCKILYNMNILKLWLYSEYVLSSPWISQDVPYHLKYYKPKNTKCSTQKVNMVIKTFKFLKEIFTRQLHLFIGISNNFAKQSCTRYLHSVVVRSVYAIFFYHSLSDIFSGLYLDFCI